MALVDSSVLYASLDRSDARHTRCAQLLRSPDFRLAFPTLILCETLHLIGQRLGNSVEVTFLRSLPGLELVTPRPEDWQRIAELVQTYSSLPLGGVDASIIALAERLNTDLIFTLDRRHFSVVRPRHVPAFRLLPE